MFDAVIFDWDGTLADTHLVIISYFQETLKEMINIHVSSKFIERYIGICAAEIFREMLRHSGALFNGKLVEQLV
jgi:beta-phosphoglucomutase-like phosphatase (HAD superfamily)